MLKRLFKPRKLMCLARLGATALIFGSVALAAARADAGTLTLEHGEHRVVLDRSALLARPDAQDIEVDRDIGYGGATRRYRAVPLSAILNLLPASPSVRRTLEGVALDGFAAQIPLPLVLNGAADAARAWLAIEPPEAPWPALPNKSVSAGPFYVVWQGTEGMRISPEYWPYQLAMLRMVDHPADRWPQLAVDQNLPADHAARRGQEVYVSVCIACHRMNGAGSSDMGPDLNQPMNPTEYFQPTALRQYLRDPASVRSWPGQSMTGYTREHISDAEMDALLAYLAHMATRRAPP